MGRDSAGRTVLQLAVDDRVFEKLMAFDADAAELEHQGDDEPDADDERDELPIVGEFVRPRVARRRRTMAPSFGQVG